MLKTIVLCRGRESPLFIVLKTVTLVIVCSLVLTACESIGYYSQAISGHWQILRQRQSIETLISDESVDGDLRKRLQYLQSVRKFATSELFLPDNNSYRYYSDIGREFVVWNVFAANEFSVTPKQWCFPFAGCVDYKGYFSRQDAVDYATRLNSEGYDTHVGGVVAYSTLGWFDDPVLNTFISQDDMRLAGLVFHELAHQKLYLPGETGFNESFAMAVEIAGIERWFGQSSRTTSDYMKSQRIRADFVATMLGGRQQLALLYQTEIPVTAMKRGKQDVIDQMIDDAYMSFKRRWDGIDTYDRWLGLPDRPHLNNAKLSTVSSYYQMLPIFEKILSEEGGDLAAFYRRVEKLAALSKGQRQQFFTDTFASEIKLIQRN
ncbi:MAG: aminopeptidase [Oceanicoccus sp.]